MAGTDEIVKRLLVEIDGNVEKLRRELQKGEADVKRFSTEANKAGRTAGAGADVVVNKQANAARAIASATETIARQGKVSGEAAKQLIAQGANAALFFGPQGAIVGAIGIATLAMVGMFTRVKRELAETERRTLEVMNRFAEMDATAQARAINRLASGDRFVGALGTSDEDLSVESLERRGLRRLEADRARLAAQVAAGNQRFQAGMGAGATTEQREAVAALETQRTQLAAVDRALAELNARQSEQLALLRESGEQSARTALAIAGQADATRTVTEAERARKQALRELDEEAKAVGTDFERMALGALSSAEKVAAPFDALIERARALVAAGRDVDENLARISALEQLRDQAVQATVAIADAEKLLAGLGQSARLGVKPTADTFIALNAEISKLRALLVGYTEDSDDYKKILAEIVRLEKERANLLNGITDGDSDDEPKLDVRTAADYAREIQQAADGALQLAQNLGGADKNAIGLLRTVGQIAAGAVGLAEAIKSGSAGGIIGSSLAILGALSSAIGESPAEKQSREELRRNTDALKDLTKKAGQIGLGVTGTAAGGAAAGLNAFLGSNFATAGSLPGFGDARTWAKKFGLDMAELDKIAKEHGITLNGNIESFHQLAEAIGLTITKLGEFDTTVDSQVAQAEAQIDIFGVTDPLEQLKIRQGARAGRSSALDSVTAGLDLSTAEGREQARKNAEILFQTMMAGGGTLSEGELGGLTGNQLLEALRELTNGLDAIDAAAGMGTAGSSSGTIVGLRSLTEATGSRLEDRFRSLDVKASAAQETRVAMLGALMQIANAVLPVPSIPSSFALARAQGGAAAGAGSFTVVIEPGAVVFNMPVTFATDPGPILSAVQDGMEAAINEAVYRATLREQRIRGDLRLSV